MSLCHSKSAKAVTGIVVKTTEAGHFALENLKQTTPKKVALGTAKFSLRTTAEIAKGSVYPFWFLGKSGFEYLYSKEPNRLDGLKEVWANRVKHDKGAAFVGLILWSLAETTGLTVNQYHKHTADFDEEEAGEEEGLIVVIDNFGEDLFYRGVGDYVANNLYLPRYGDRVIVLKGVALDDIPVELKKLVKQYGRSIQKVDYYGHGLVGEVVQFYRTHKEFTNLSTAVNYRFPYPGAPLLKTPIETEFLTSLIDLRWHREMVQTKLEPHLFCKNAKIRFNSCFIGNGPDGELFGRGIANAWLRRGGTVYTSTVQILPSVGEFVGLKTGLPIPSRYVRTFTDDLLPLRGAITAYTLLYELPMFNSNPDRVERPFLLPHQRVKKHATSGESPLRDEFEKAWASGFVLDKKKVYSVFDSGDVRHYSPLRNGTPRRVDRLLIREIELEGNDIDTPYGVHLLFENGAKAREYVSYLELDPELMDAPQFEADGVFLKMKLGAKKIIEKRQYAQGIKSAEFAKKHLKEVYQKNLKAFPLEAEKYYNEYRSMLPLYLFSGGLSHELPRNPDLYQAIDTLLE